MTEFWHFCGKYVFFADGGFEGICLVVGGLIMAGGLLNRFCDPDYFDSTKPTFVCMRALSLAVAMYVLPNLVNLVWPFHVSGETVDCFDNCSAGSVPRGVIHHPDAKEEQLIRNGEYDKGWIPEGLAIVLILSYGVMLLRRPKIVAGASEDVCGSTLSGGVS